MQIFITSGKPRKEPKCGDRKTVKGVEYVRVFSRVRSGPDAGAYIMRGRKHVYEWERMP